MDTVGHLARDSDGKHAPPKSQPVHPAPVPPYLHFGEVVDGMYHRRYSAEQHIRKGVAQGVGVGVYHLRPKMFHGAGNPPKHRRVEAPLLTHVPYLYSVLRESSLRGQAERAA